MATVPCRAACGASSDGMQSIRGQPIGPRLESATSPQCKSCAALRKREKTLTVLPQSAVRRTPIPESTSEILNPLGEHDRWMRAAIAEAQAAFDEGEVPVGAVIVHEGRVIAAAHNQRETLNDPTAHAEMIALTQAAEALQSWRLLDCALYVTLEPCPMCAGAIVQARLPTVVYGTSDPKAGACHTLYQITSDPRLNHQATVLGGVLGQECRSLLQQFFAEQRALGKK